MRLIHVSDIHIGHSGVWDRPSENGWPESLVEDQALLMSLVEYAIREQVDAVLFSGDAYKSRTPTPTQQGVFARAISVLYLNNIPVVLLPGNHDKPGIDSYSTTLSVYGDIPLDNVTVCDLPGIYRVRDFNVIAFPWGTFDAENYGKYIAEAREDGVPVITTAHLSILDCPAGTEQGMVLGKETVWPIESLAQPGVDYVALGHIHRHRVWYMPNGVTVAYPGSLQRLDFGDEDDAKGFYVVEIPDDKSHSAEVEFVPVPAREFLTVDWCINSPFVEVNGLQDVIVRVQATLTEGEASNNPIDEQIRSALSDARFVTIHKEIVKDRKTRADSSITTMGPIEALEQYLTIKDYSPERIEELKSVARGMIE